MEAAKRAAARDTIAGAVVVATAGGPTATTMLAAGTTSATPLAGAGGADTGTAVRALGIAGHIAAE